MEVEVEVEGTCPRTVTMVKSMLLVVGYWGGYPCMYVPKYVSYM